MDQLYATAGALMIFWIGLKRGVDPLEAMPFVYIFPDG